jgi:hypothetical protein
MSRSYKKPFITISKAWDRFKERRYRHRVRRAANEASIDFDPDRDFEELSLDNKKMGSFGTRMGWDVPPDEGDSTWMHQTYRESQRK